MIGEYIAGEIVVQVGLFPCFSLADDLIRAVFKGDHDQVGFIDGINRPFGIVEFFILDLLVPHQDDFGPLHVCHPFCRVRSWEKTDVIVILQ